jgi:hypothetical protein
MKRQSLLMEYLNTSLIEINVRRVVRSFEYRGAPSRRTCRFDKTCESQNRKRYMLPSPKQTFGTIRTFPRLKTRVSLPFWKERRYQKPRCRGIPT